MHDGEAAETYLQSKGTITSITEGFSEYFVVPFTNFSTCPIKSSKVGKLASRSAITAKTKQNKNFLNVYPMK